ncbi:MAG: MAPEG family protein [Aestuariibacter sp.]
MEVLLISLFITTLLPIVAKAPLAYAMNKDGGYDNRHPRQQQDRLTGFGLRAKAAHLNSFEALAMYAPGVLAVVALDAATDLIQYYAIGFVFCRLAYLAMYWFNLDKLRSLFWLAGFALSLMILWHAVAVATAMN